MVPPRVSIGVPTIAQIKIEYAFEMFDHDKIGKVKRVSVTSPRDEKGTRSFDLSC